MASVFDFRTAYNVVERRIEDHYGIPVMTSDVVDPNTGDFDGERIQIDYDQDTESAFFVLVHLFGHTVQWNLSEEYRQLGIETQPGKSEEELLRLHTYEKDATRYSLRLMHDAKLTHLDRWLSDWWWADWRYLSHYYRTGERVPFRTFIEAGQGELLTPLDIPNFTPRRWVSRWSF